MIAQKRPPALARRSALPFHHVLCDSGLSDLEAELQKLAMDAGRAPERVLMDLFRKCGEAIVSACGAFFELCRAEEVKRRVSPGRIVEPVDIAGNGGFRLGTRMEDRAPDQL